MKEMEKVKWCDCGWLEGRHVEQADCLEMKALLASRDAPSQEAITPPTGAGFEQLIDSARHLLFDVVTRPLTDDEKLGRLYAARVDIERATNRIVEKPRRPDCVRDEYLNFLSDMKDDIDSVPDGDLVMEDSVRWLQEEFNLMEDAATLVFEYWRVTPRMGT